MLHLVSPLSQGLFHKIIALSGSASSPFLHNDRKPNSYARAFAKHLLKKKLINRMDDTISDDELLEMMKTIPAKTIAENSVLFKAQCSKIGKNCNFKSAKKHYLHFQKWKKINFCARKFFKTTKNAIIVGLKKNQDFW